MRGRIRSFEESMQGLRGYSWLNHLEDLKAARQELKEYGGMMTAYERSVIQRDIAERVARATQPVTAGALGEFEAAAESYRLAGAMRARAKTEEVRRWDSVKLKNEMETARALVQLALAMPSGSFVSQPSPAERLRVIYQDAKDSGDLHRMRAAAEVMSTAYPLTDGMQPDERFEINHLAHEAERDLAALRVTEAMTQAQAEEVEAARALVEQKDRLEKTYEILHGGQPSVFDPFDPLLRAANRVQVDERGGLVLLDENDPKVTGIEFRFNDRDETG